MENIAITQEVKPPNTSKSPLKWLQDNLFNTWYNTILTCLALVFLFFVFRGVLTWVFTQAKWEVIPANLQILMIGAYPIEQAWRIWIVLYTLFVLLGLSAGVWQGLVLRISTAIAIFGLILLLIPLDLVKNSETESATLEYNFNIIYLIFFKRRWLLGGLVLFVVSFFLGRDRNELKRWAIGGWVLSFPWTMIMLHGFGENTVSTTNWGGLLLTLILAAVGIVVCFPLGVLLALGRRSQLPAIKWVSTIYIETIRGVPLVTILFMGSIIFPIFMPGDFQLDKVIRAMIALTLFSAAYMAENVRGGLQAIPQGQIEAAQAVGLTYPKTMLFIVLPQALRSVIPAIVGQFISLFKDTSLVTIVGLQDLLGIARSILGNPKWQGYYVELYLFVAAIYFVFCYAMSYVSRKIEADLGVGKH
ncbi:MAG: amino acid ABC transporter permease [Candidatus Poribacteria bacterium]|nr:amino acid ABC transporter permease [Candidatus Poribacteria bacterium]